MYVVGSDLSFTLSFFLDAVSGRLFFCVLVFHFLEIPVLSLLDSILPFM